MTLPVAGTRIPTLTLEDDEGRLRPLFTAPDGVERLLVFFKLSCPTCRFTWPVIGKLVEALPADVPLKVVGVSQDDGPTTRSYFESEGLNADCLMDPPPFPVSDALGLQVVPTLMLVDGEGYVVWVEEGFSKPALLRLRHRIRTLTAADGPDIPALASGAPDYRPG